MTGTQRAPFHLHGSPTQAAFPSFNLSTLLSLSGKGHRASPTLGRRRPGHRQGWEEKVASVAQSARVFATRDGLLVGQSQLRAPDPALGERTNKCSLVRIPALGVKTGGDLGRTPASSPPSLPRSSWCLEHLGQWPQLRGRSARLAPNLSALGLGSCTQGTPLEPVDLELLAPPPRAPPPSPAFFGEELSAIGRVPEGHPPHCARFSVLPSPGYNLRAKLPPG